MHNKSDVCAQHTQWGQEGQGEYGVTRGVQWGGIGTVECPAAEKSCSIVTKSYGIVHQAARLTEKTKAKAMCAVSGCLHTLSGCL